MVVDISQDSDSEESSSDEEAEPAPDNLVWLHPEQIIARDSLNTRPVHQDLFRQLNDSGMFVEEIILIFITWSTGVTILSHLVKLVECQ